MFLPKRPVEEEKILSEWPSLFEKREIQDMIHGTISLFYPLDQVVDTREFQRLRELKQQGVSYLVYPCSTHSRFVHSLGAYWLAYKFVKSLKRDSSLNITSQDHLCVCMAALCHDLGHGPFSHVFDRAFRQASGTATQSESHENLSIRLLRRIVSAPKVRAALEIYLGVGKEFETNITFMEEIINPKKFDSDDRWLLQGRPVEKAFLYDIVSNSSDSIDVDKFDYLVRDSSHAGIPIPFNKHSIERLTENARVLPDPKLGYPRICYAKKVADILLSVGDSRQMMHNLVYQHRVVCAIEELVVKAMNLADKHIKYMGDDGKEYNLSNVKQNLEAYLKTTDAVLRDIANSSNPEISYARKILEDIGRRNTPVMIAEAECGPSYTESRFALQRRISQSLRSRLGAYYDEISLGPYYDENILILVREINRGLDGRTHPMTKVLLYDNKLNDKVARTVNDEWLSLRSPREAAIWSICLYVSRSMNIEERSRAVNAFDAAVAKCGVLSKRKNTLTPNG